MVSVFEDVGVSVLLLLLRGGSDFSWDLGGDLLLDVVLNGVVDGLGNLSWLLVGDLSGDLVWDFLLDFVRLLVADGLGVCVFLLLGDGVWGLVWDPLVDLVLNLS